MFLVVSKTVSVRTIQFNLLVSVELVFKVLHTYQESSEQNNLNQTLMLPVITTN